MISNILKACASFSWFLDTSMISILLFGEYEYPSKDQYE